jgi:hypothetical protein
MSLTVYLFNSDTKKYNGIWNCQESPLEENFYIQPTDSTLIEPPTFNSENQTCTWDGIEWLIADIPLPEPVIPEPVVIVEPTKSELLAELKVLTAKIEALE